MRRSGREVLGHCRPPGALTRPRDRQTTTQEEKPVPGKGSRHSGLDAMNHSGRRGSGDAAR
eukprot:475674-Pyramimonas_sp.AAC.1